MSDTVLVSFTLEEWAEVKRAIGNNSPYADRISIGLAIRLSRPRHERERLDVLREIDALEGLGPETRTKRADQFKYAPLFPLWHKHYFTSRHLLRNIGDRWNVARGQGNRDLDSCLSEIVTKCGDDPARWPGELVHRLFIDGITERADAQRMSGDWIIFGKHEGQNYYLDLATHEEGRDDPIQLVEKLRFSSQVDFPFLFDRES